MTVTPVECTVERFRRVRDHTEELIAPLSPEDQTVQSMPDVSPAKWHRAHTTWFFETFVLGAYVRGYEVFDPGFGYLFNSYYEAVGARYPRPQRGLVTRPGAAEVGEYRQFVDRAMVDLLSGGVDPSVSALVELGLHHEQQHQELILMDIKHVLAQNPARPAYRQDPTPGLHPASVSPGGGWRSCPGGVTEVGSSGRDFCFDNETPRHRVWLDPFDIAESLVTCGAWLEFMSDGGYQRPELWMSDGWAQRCALGWEAPLYWVAAGSDREWDVFTLHGCRPVDPFEAVVHVSWYEADAFARWSGARLPTEAEWETAAPPVDQGLGDGWFGQVWQWTASPYVAYPGFVPAPGAVGEYNGKFMVNQLTLRGSSVASPEGHARSTYRNFFGPGARWPFGGLRLAR